VLLDDDEDELLDELLLEPLCVPPQAVIARSTESRIIIFMAHRDLLE
jgi:hypothetical protein